MDPEDVRHRPKKDSFERNHHRPSPIGDTHALNTLPARTTSGKLGPDSWEKLHQAWLPSAEETKG
jgi:hypothetical protein